MNKTLLPILAISVIVLVGVAGMVYWSMVNAPEVPPDEPGESPGWGFRAENSTDGNWNVSIVTGSLPLKNLRMMIIDPNNGAKTVDKLIADLVAAKNDPEAVFNDSNANNRFDAGDSVLLKCSSQNIKSGYRVQFLDGESVIGTINELP